MTASPHRGSCGPNLDLENVIDPESNLTLQ